MEWVFHSEAEAEFIESAAHFEREVSGLGRRFGRAVKEALENIVEHPEIGSRLNGELRSFVVAGFPYSIIYAPYQGSLFGLGRCSRQAKAWLLGISQFPLTKGSTGPRQASRRQCRNGSVAAPVNPNVAFRVLAFSDVIL